MAASQTLHIPRSVTTTSGEYSSDEAQQPRSIDRNYQLPPNTRAVLGVLSEEVLTKLRAINLPDEFKSLTVPEVLSAIVAFFSSGEITTQLARISDKALYESVQALGASGALTIETINDFATQFFDPNGGASKGLLIGAIGQLLEDLYRAYIKLDELLIEAVKVENAPPKLEPPALNVSTRPEACEVLDQSEGDQKWEPEEARPLELNALTDPYSIAHIVDRSDDIDPHAHLLVDTHYAVSGDGLLRPISVPEVPSSSSHWQGDSSVTLRFEGEQPSEALAEIPRFSITGVRDLDSGSDDTQADGPGYEITYTTDPEKEQNFYHSPWNSDRAELCVPEIFLKLVEKFDELDCSEEEKAQLVAQVFHSQNLIYSRHEQLSELLAACEPRHRLSLILGLGMGDCTLLSAALQQLLAHAEVNAVIEAGAICSEDGESYERPGHARVKVYGSESILRLDPTTWCVRSISVNSIDDESLEALTEELRTADAKTCYQVGQRARKLLTTPTWAHSDVRSADPGNENGSDSDRLSNERYDPERGHQLRDDFEPQTQVALYRILASNKQELLIADVWEAYQEVLDSCSDEVDEAGFGTRGARFLTEEMAANLEKEVQLVGLDQSKLLELIPEMLQTLTRKYEYGDDDYNEFSDFIGAIHSIELRTAVLARTLETSTRYLCAFALCQHCELTPSPESTRFLVRLIHLMTGEAAGFGFDDGGLHFNRELLLLTARFPKQYRDQIIAAYAQYYGEDVDGLVSLISDGTLYSPQNFPREVFASIFPAFKNSPVEVAQKVLTNLDDFFSPRGPWKRPKIDEQYLAMLLIVCQYFPAHVRPELKPLVTAYVAQYLRDYGEKSVDFRVSAAVSELCNLVHINDKETGLERQDFWKPHQLYIESCFPLSISILPECEPLRPFIQGYLLKELSTLGLLDPDEIADCLYSPSKKEIKVAFDMLHVTRLLNAGHEGYDDSSKMHKAVQLAAAILAECRRKGAVVSHANLLIDAVYFFGLVDQATLDLVKIVLSHRKAKVNEALLETAIPDAIAYLFSIRDSLKLRSYIRMRTACAVLDASSAAVGSASNVTEQIKQELLREDDLLKAKNSAYPTMAQLYCDVDSRYLTLESEDQRLQHRRLQSFSIAVKDGLISRGALHRVIESTREALSSQKLSGDDRERACQIVLSLLNRFPVDPQSSAVLARASRVTPRVWQDEVAKSLRLQRTEGGAQIRRKISQSRSDNVDSHRNYVPGDDIRAIDWRATAKSDRLVVRTYQKSSRSIADSYHILLDLADFIESPEFEFASNGVEFKMNELQLDTKMFAAIADFINSLAEENRPVRLSVFAFGASVIDTVISTGQGSSKDDVDARTQALEALFRYAQSYAALCYAIQCVPDAHSLAGLMNPHERAHFVKQIEPGQLVLHLHGKAAAGNPIEPALRELAAAGKAARVLIEL